jgi:hypothetical protein
VTAWAAPEPHRTVLSVQEAGGVVRMQLATAPSRHDRAVIRAELASREVVRGPLRFADHTYRARVQAGPFVLPWMKNEYASALPEWPARALTLETGSFTAGRWAATGFLLIAIAAVCAAGRALGGPAGASVAGLFLAAEPSLLGWSRVIGGHALGPVALAALQTTLALRAAGGDRRADVLSALCCGVGLGWKPNYLAVGLPLLGVAGIRTGLWPARIAALALGASPTLAYLALRPAPASVGHDVSISMRVREASERLRGAPPGEAATKRTGSPAETALRPLRAWTLWWSEIDRHSNDGSAPTTPAPPVDTPRVVLLVGALGALWASRQPGPGRRLALATGAAAIAIPVLHPDAHHRALWLPLLAIVLSSSGRAWPRGARVLALALALEGGAMAARLEPELRARVGRTLDAAALSELADGLASVGAFAPAVFDRELTSLLEAETGGAVRPFLYARAVAGLPLHSRPWLAAILSAHRGGHALDVWGRRGPRGDAGAFVGRTRLDEAARTAGVELDEVRRFADDRGRWYATLYAVR